MAVKAPIKPEVEQYIATLMDDFDEYPEAVLNRYGPNQRVMARGDSELKLIQFIVHNECGSLSLTSVSDGTADYSASARFDPGLKEFDVANIDPRRPDRVAAIRSAKLLLPAAIEAEPLPIDREVAQLFVDTMAFSPYRER